MPQQNILIPDIALSLLSMIPLSLKSNIQT